MEGKMGIVPIQMLKLSIKIAEAGLIYVFCREVTGSLRNFLYDRGVIPVISLNVLVKEFTSQKPSSEEIIETFISPFLPNIVFARSILLSDMNFFGVRPVCFLNVLQK